MFPVDHPTVSLYVVVLIIHQGCESMSYSKHIQTMYRHGMFRMQFLSVGSCTAFLKSVFVELLITLFSKLT